MKNQGTFCLLRNGRAIAENKIPITQDIALFLRWPLEALGTD